MMIDTIINKKQLDRATRMRDGDDQTTIDALKEVVASSMVAQTARSKKMVQRSLEEVNQVARDIVNGQIKMDETRKKKFVGRLKHLSDDMKSQMENGDFEKKTEKMTSKLKDIMPSPQTLMSAVMTANPMLGFALRTGGAVKGALGKSRGGSNTQEQIELAKQAINDNFDDIQSQSEQATDKITSSLSPYNSEQAINVLMGIEREMITLRQIWDDNDDTQNDIRATLDGIRDTDEQQLKEARLQRESAEAQATEDRREASRVDEAGNLIDGGGDDETDSMLASILGGVGGGGLMAGLMSVFGTLKTVGSIGIKFLGKGTLIGAAILAIYDFFDGFFSAGDILDKEEGSLTIKDRISAGIGSVITGFLDLINMITSWFGLDFMSWFDGDPKKIISKAINETLDDVISGFMSIFDRFKAIFTNVFSLFSGEESFDVGKVMTILGDIGKDLLAIPITWANSLLSAFGLVEKMDDEQVDGVIDSIFDTIKDTVDKAFDWMLDILDFDIDFSSIADDVKIMVKGFTDDIKNFAKNKIKETWNGIKSFVGLGDDESPKEMMINGKKASELEVGESYSETTQTSSNKTNDSPSLWNRVSSLFGDDDESPKRGVGVVDMFAEKSNDDSVKQSIKSPNEYMDSGSMAKSLENDNIIITTEDDIKSYFDGIIKGASTISELKNTEDSERQREKSENSKGNGQTMINAPSSVNNNVNNTTVQTTDNTSNKDFSFGRMSYMPFMNSYE